jgi:AraC-like DNA-binding protein
MPTTAGVTYSEIPIHPDLARHVQLIWMLDVDDAVSFGNAERILPDGIVEAVFHYREPFAMRYRGTSFDRQPMSLVVSQTRRFIEIEPAGPGGFVSVRFYPWGARHFFAVPVSTFADRTVTAADLWGREVEQIEDQLSVARSVRERGRLMQAFLLRQLRRYRKNSIEALVRAVGGYSSEDRVNTVCRDLGVSQRMLERTFGQALGYSPKHFLRLRRFLRTCQLLRRVEQPRLTDIALQAGYYDQAHCIADFHAFAGMTPRQFIAAEKAVFLDVS